MATVLEYAEATDPGLDPHKRVNEDACAHADTALGRLFVVCDGMGGHAGGKQASEIAIRTVLEHMAQPAPGLGPQAALVRAIEQAARRVYEFGGPANNPHRPGSTCVAILIHDGVTEVAHVGDSRAFAIRGKQIHRLTRDHSYVQELLDQGAITEQQAIGHPEGNKITRALGMTPTVEVEAMPEPLELFDGDVFLLASDGLTDLAQPHDILKTTVAYLRSDGPETACAELVALANRRGGHDNITVQLVRVVSAGPKLARTRVEAQHFGASGQTLVASPHGLVSATEPGAPMTAAHGDPYAAAPPSWNYAPPSLPLAPLAAPPGTNPLMYVVIGLNAVIGILLALLLWALLLRN